MLGTDLGHSGIIRVVNQGRVGVQLGHNGPPPLRQVFKFAVAVELIAEQVHQDHYSWAGLCHQSTKGGLVHFEQSDVRVCGVEQRSSHTSFQVGTCGVGHNLGTGGIEC